MDLKFVLTQLIVSFIYITIYFLIFRKSTKFTLNRFYLLSTVLLATFIPLISFDVFPTEAVPIKLPNVNKSVNPVVNNEQNINILFIIYAIGVFIAAVVFLYNIIFISKLILSNAFTKDGKYYVHDGCNNAFSFFNFIFVEKSNAVQLAHEKAHASLLHSIDRMLLAIITIACWYNPFIYLYRYFIIENHEYQADTLATKKLNVSHENYTQKLLDYLSQTQKTSLTNNFNSLIKNRIVMLLSTKKQSKLHLLMIPAIVVVFSAFTFKTYPVIKQMNSNVEMVGDTVPKESKNKRQAKNEAKLKTQKASKDDGLKQDTVITFDPATNQETMVIIQNHPDSPNGNTIIKADKMEYEKNFDLDKYLKDLTLSGKITTIVDTLVIFDPETYVETVHVDSYDLPMEISRIMGQLKSYEERIKVKEKYATNMKTSMIKNK